MAKNLSAPINPQKGSRIYSHGILLITPAIWLVWYLTDGSDPWLIWQAPTGQLEYCTSTLEYLKQFKNRIMNQQQKTFKDAS